MPFPFKAVPARLIKETQMSRTKRITLGIAAGALALGAGLGVSGMASAATLKRCGRGGKQAATR